MILTSWSTHLRIFHNNRWPYSMSSCRGTLPVLSLAKQWAAVSTQFWLTMDPKQDLSLPHSGYREGKMSVCKNPLDNIEHKEFLIEIKFLLISESRARGWCKLSSHRPAHPSRCLPEPPHTWSHSRHLIYRLNKWMFPLQFFTFVFFNKHEMWKINH